MLMKPSNRTRKAQSAMEYLMTYGWAILIIAVVLGALFSLGVFSSSNLLGSACIASSGYLCQTPTYVHGTVASGSTAGNILVTLGQNTGTNWATANFVFVPSGTALTSSGLPSIRFNATAPTAANTAYAGTGLISGQQVQIYLPNNALGSLPSPPTVAVGTAATGAIWAQYTTASNPNAQYVQVATINIKAS
jgi:hypothetical protein